MTRAMLPVARDRVWRLRNLNVFSDLDSDEEVLEFDDRP